jgi:hypothetical protein
MADRFPYEQSEWHNSLEKKKFWYEQLERSGLAAVKFKLSQDSAGSGGSIAVGREISLTKGFAEEWVAWHDAQQAAADAAFQAKQVRWAKIAAWAGIAAAVLSAIGIAVQFWLDK